MASLLYLALLVASPEICLAKQAYFSAIDAEDISVQSDLIATFDTPSELSCSQRCFRHEECKYKKYDASSHKCEVFKSLAEEDVTEMAQVSKKETYVDTVCNYVYILFISVSCICLLLMSFNLPNTVFVHSF